MRPYLFARGLIIGQYKGLNGFAPPKVRLFTSGLDDTSGALHLSATSLTFITMFFIRPLLSSTMFSTTYTLVSSGVIAYARVEQPLASLILCVALPTSPPPATGFFKIERQQVAW